MNSTDEATYQQQSNISSNLAEEQFPNYMLYASYKDAGPSVALILPAALMNLAGVPGIAANLLLIWVTWRKKSLRGSANFLLALTAFFEILHQSAHFLFLIITATGINFITYATALHFQLHSIIGLTAAQTLMASTAADRLLSVLMPMNYEHINGFWYLLGHTLLAVANGAWMAAYAVCFASKHADLPVTGYISDLLVLDMELMFKFIMLLCAVNTVLYALVWAVVRFGPAGNTIDRERHAKLFRSLVVIVLIVIGGYLLNNVCRLIINHTLTLDDIQMWKVNVFGGILLNIGASAETPTLYIFSTDYRKAINQECRRLFGRVGPGKQGGGHHHPNVTKISTAIFVSNAAVPIRGSMGGAPTAAMGGGAKRMSNSNGRRSIQPFGHFATANGGSVAAAEGGRRLHSLK